jgi:large subunit ribosomal protein L33
MAKAAARVQVKLKSSESPHVYYTMKNKRNTPDRIELRKYDPSPRELQGREVDSSFPRI